MDLPEILPATPVHSPMKPKPASPVSPASRSDDAGNLPPDTVTTTTSQRTPDAPIPRLDAPPPIPRKKSLGTQTRRPDSDSLGAAARQLFEGNPILSPRESSTSQPPR